MLSWECGRKQAAPPTSLKAVIGMAISEAQKRAVRKYKESNYDRLEISVPKGKKADLQAHAQERGESLNGFVNRAIDETVERERGDEANAANV
jgi:predicted HicB family RNase H-like nuclease